MKKGTTTRIIDRCIQQFFSNGFTFVYDGRGSETMRKQTDDAHSKFIARLDQEHPGTKYVSHFDNFSGIECYKVVNHNL